MRGGQRRDYAEERDGRASGGTLAARVGSEVDVHPGGWVPGRGKGSQKPAEVAMKALGRCVPAARRKYSWEPRVAPIVRPPKASVRAERPQSACSQRVTTHGAAPPCLPKPNLRGQGLSTRILGFLLFSSLPDLLTVRGVAKAQEILLPITHPC